MITGKQQPADLMNEKDWTQHLPVGYDVRLRIDSQTVRERVLPSGDTWRGTDLRWHLSGGYVPEVAQTALMLVGPNGEVPKVFRRVVI